MDFSKPLPKPYKITYSPKSKMHEVIYDDTVLFGFPKGTDIDFLQRIESTLNGAYLEGYMQKERETGEKDGNK